MSIYLDFNDPTVKAKLANLPEKMLDYAEEVLLDAAHLMVGLAQVYAPVDTGSLRDSIRVERGGTGMGWRGVSVRAGGYVVNPKTGLLVNYAAICEARTPYMRPAFDQVEPTIAEMIKSKVVEKISE